MVGHAFNHSSRETGKWISESKASLVYRVRTHLKITKGHACFSISHPGKECTAERGRERERENVLYLLLMLRKTDVVISKEGEKNLTSSARRISHKRIAHCMYKL